MARVDDARLTEAIAAAVTLANARLARSEQVRRFAVLVADLSEAGGMVTPTLKLKRAALAARVHHVIRGLYSDEGVATG